MKLRPYTAAETDELIGKFSVITEYWYSIQEKTSKLILDRHEEYLSTFRKSLFRWKPLNLEKFVNELASSHVYLQDYKKEENSRSLFFKNLLTKDCTYFRGVGYFTTIYDYILTRYGNNPFSNEEKELLREASDVTDDIYFNYDLRSKYDILLKYANRPFEFDESDIKWIETVERYYDRAIKWNSN